MTHTSTLQIMQPIIGKVLPSIVTSKASWGERSCDNIEPKSPGCPAMPYLHILPQYSLPHANKFSVKSSSTVRVVSRRTQYNTILCWPAASGRGAQSPSRVLLLIRSSTKSASLYILRRSCKANAQHTMSPSTPQHKHFQT